MWFGPQIWKQRGSVVLADAPWTDRKIRLLSLFPFVNQLFQVVISLLTVLNHMYVYICIHIDSFIRKAELEFSVCCLAGSLPLWCNGWAIGSQSLELLSGVPHEWQGPKSSPTTFPDAIAGNCIGNGTTRTRTSAHIVCLHYITGGSLTYCATTQPPVLPFQLI